MSKSNHLSERIAGLDPAQLACLHAALMDAGCLMGDEEHRICLTMQSHRSEGIDANVRATLEARRLRLVAGRNVLHAVLSNLQQPASGRADLARLIDTVPSPGIAHAILLMMGAMDAAGDAEPVGDGLRKILHERAAAVPPPLVPALVQAVEAICAARPTPADAGRQSG